jgi:hypothetical protein
MAALNVHSGEILATDAVRNDADNFIAYLAQIDIATPDELTVQLMLDNGASHIAKRTAAWLAEHPRFNRPPHLETRVVAEPGRTVLFHPQPELLHRGEFASRDELVVRIMAFIHEHNRTGRPFALTYDGTPLKIA